MGYVTERERESESTIRLNHSARLGGGGGVVTDPITLIGGLLEAGPPDCMDISAWLAPLRLNLNCAKPKQ